MRPADPTLDDCPGCGGSQSISVAILNQVPVFSNVLWTSSEGAQGAVRGDLRLRSCRDCSLVYNAAFQPELVRYASNYENSQLHSQHFRTYLEQLAQRLVEGFSLSQKTIVEIGCGDGFFLRRLCDVGGNRGVGFDPAFAGVATETQDVCFVPAAFHPSALEDSVDLVCARHVLEHLHQPRMLLEEVRCSLGGRDSSVYFEVPNAWLTFANGAIWDLLYEHCLYFTEPSLVNLLQRSGYVVSDLRTDFDGQFLSIQASPADDAPDLWRSRLDVDRVVSVSANLQQHIDNLVSQWDQRLTAWSRAGRTFALWGAGTKGVMFLNLVPGAKDALAIVDVNPRKQGCYTAGTGHAIVAPEALLQLRPSCVLVMNPIYRQEIQRMIDALSLEVELVDVMDSVA